MLFETITGLKRPSYGQISDLNSLKDSNWQCFTHNELINLDKLAASSSTKDRWYFWAAMNEQKLFLFSMDLICGQLTPKTQFTEKHGKGSRLKSLTPKSDQLFFYNKVITPPSLSAATMAKVIIGTTGIPTVTRFHSITAAHRLDWKSTSLAEPLFVRGFHSMSLVLKSLGTFFVKPSSGLCR